MERTVAGGEISSAFEIVRRLGAGGNGTVYLVRWMLPPLKGMLRAVKVPHADAYLRPQELEALALLRHTNIAHVQPPPDDFANAVVMEYVEGPNLLAAFGNPDSEYPRWTVEQRIRVMIPIADALAHAGERGILHRDVSPMNVILVEGEALPVAMLVDWGSAAFGDVESAQPFGSPQFRAPEVAQGRAYLNVTDVFSFGATLYWLLTGARLEESWRDPGFASARVTPGHYGGREGAARRRLRRDFDCILRKCTEVDPARRYKCARELIADLTRALHHQPVAATLAALGERPAPRTAEPSQPAPAPASASSLSEMAVSAPVGAPSATPAPVESAPIRARAPAVAHTHRFFYRADRFARRNHWGLTVGAGAAAFLFAVGVRLGVVDDSPWVTERVTAIHSPAGVAASARPQPPPPAHASPLQIACHPNFWTVVGAEVYERRRVDDRGGILKVGFNACKRRSDGLDGVEVSIYPPRKAPHYRKCVPMSWIPECDAATRRLELEERFQAEAELPSSANRKLYESASLAGVGEMLTAICEGDPKLEANAQRLGPFFRLLLWKIYDDRGSTAAAAFLRDFRDAVEDVGDANPGARFREIFSRITSDDPTISQLFVAAVRDLQ